MPRCAGAPPPSTFADLGNSTKLRLFDSIADVREMADIDEDTFAVVMRIIFAGNPEPLLDLPVINTYQAAVMLEVMKDFLYQAYVRKGRLQQAMKVRKFFVEEATANLLLPGAGGECPFSPPSGARCRTCGTSRCTRPPHPAATNSARSGTNARDAAW